MSVTFQLIPKVGYSIFHKHGLLIVDSTGSRDNRNRQQATSPGRAVKAEI